MKKEETPYQTVEKWLESYASWKSRVEFLQHKLQNIPGLTQRFELVAIHGKGQKNEAVLNEVIRRLEIKEDELPLLALRIELMETAFSALTPEEREFVELKYIKKLANILTMDRLGLSRRAFFYKKKHILVKMYEELGGSESLMWIEPTEIG